MSSLSEVSPAYLATLVQGCREILAKDLNRDGHEEASASWERASEEVRTLMLAAARLALLEPEQVVTQEAPRNKYFAKPGEANWGC